MLATRITLPRLPIFVIGSRSRAGGCGLTARARRRAGAPVPLIAAAFLLVAAPTAKAAVTFYTTEAAWTAAVDAVAVDSFDTSAANIVLADNLISIPTQDAQLGSQLTFSAGSTGLCASFTIQTLEPGAGLTFDDGEPSPSIFPADTLSIGDIDDFQDDDFRLTFPTRSVFAVGLFLVNNTQVSSESFSAFGSGGLLGSLDGSSIPDSSGHGSTFVGVVASEPLVSVRFDEDADVEADDIAIRDFRLGCAAEDPDGDGLSNLAEQRAGTDPNDADTDDDGLLDGQELGTGSFGAQQVISTLADRPRSVFAVDVDGDGDTDVISASIDDDEIAWYENMDGVGGFGVQQVISTLADRAFSVFAADADRDGDLDVLSASFNDAKVAWYENTDGAGAFGAQQLISTLSSGADSVFAADMDGDGDTDVLSASFLFSRIAWTRTPTERGASGPSR